MQKSKVVFIKPRNVLSFFRESYAFIIMFSVYIIGILIGSIFVKRAILSGEQIKTLLNLSEVFQGFWNQFYSFIINWIPSLLIISLFGTCMAGIVIIPCLVCVKGIEYGVLSGYLYSHYSFNGVIYVILLVLPSVFCSAYCLFFAGRESFAFSLKLLKHTLPEPRSEYLYPRLTAFCRRILLYLFFTILAGFLDAALNTAFFDSVSFL